MSNFLKRLAVVLGILAVGLITPASAPVQAQGVNLQGIQVVPFSATYVSHIVTAADTDELGYIKYFGPGGASTTTIAVEADGNLTAVVNGAAYTGFECPVSGALGGVIDVSDAACNTWGEVADIINATAPSFSTGYFRMILGAALRSDSSDGTALADAADTEVTRPQGDILFWDSSVNDDVQVILQPRALGWLGSGITGTRVPTNPNKGFDNVLQYGHENITNAGTITNIEVHCVVENYNDGKSLSSETDTIIYLEAAGATTVTGKVDEFINAGGLHCQNGKLIMRVLASGADTSAQTVFVTGFKRPIQAN